jgi:hypothetical protein
MWFGFLRDAIKGYNFKAHSKGFVQGASGKELDIQCGVAGSVKYSDEIFSFADEPVQTVTMQSVMTIIRFGIKFDYPHRAKKRKFKGRCIALDHRLS